MLEFGFDLDAPIMFFHARPRPAMAVSCLQVRFSGEILSSDDSPKSSIGRNDVSSSTAWVLSACATEAGKVCRCAWRQGLHKNFS